MLDMPSLEEDVISLIPLTLNSSSSMTFVIDFSTSSGEAPG